MKKLANMKEGTFVQCLSSFQLKIKCKSQRVRDKAYKVVNLTSMCPSIISMDISTAWPKPHIHTWIYPWIYPWISISMASLQILAPNNKTTSINIL